MPLTDSPRLRLRTVLVPLDGSVLAEHALSAAVALARGAGARVEVVLARAPASRLSDAGERARRDTDEQIYIAGTARLLHERWGISAQGVVLPGDAVEVICARAIESDADLIVMTSHRRTGLKRVWRGSITDGVVRRSRRPVLVARKSSRPLARETDAASASGGCAVVAIDGSPASVAVLDAAIAVARCTLASVVLLRIVEPVRFLVVEPDVPTHASPMIDSDATDAAAAEARTWLIALAEHAEHESGYPLRTDVRVATAPARAILEVAQEYGAELIAMTTHGRGASRLVVGSVADAVLRGADVSLLLLHPA
jgi:nucleotide-binding universal stress UspA family protein